MDVTQVIDYLKAYQGRELKIMEMCGTHTASIFKNGIRDFISPKIRLISGPGCPVCVTPAAFIDRCISYAAKEKHVLLTFGDMMKVPGKDGSLSQHKEKGTVHVELMYTPFEALEKAKQDPDTTYVVAAVGFETTAPVYGLMLQEAEKNAVGNIRLVTALKTVIPALDWICEKEEDVDGFLCPGHVSVITGSRVYDRMAVQYRKPFVVAGFEAEHILAALYRIVKQIESQEGRTENLYKNAVREMGNENALRVIREVFQTGSAMWRGLGRIEGSGLYLKGAFAKYDGGSRDLDEDVRLPEGCRCREVITGRLNPDNCPAFGEKCSPMAPLGPCMVSGEGACGIWYRNVR